MMNVWVTSSKALWAVNTAVTGVYKILAIIYQCAEKATDIVTMVASKVFMATGVVHVAVVAVIVHAKELRVDVIHAIFLASAVQHVKFYVTMVVHLRNVNSLVHVHLDVLLKGGVSSANGFAMKIVMSHLILPL